MYISTKDGRTPRKLCSKAIVLYLRGIRRFLDFSTGYVGVKRRVSMQQFYELLHEDVHQGSTKVPFAATKDQIRYLIKELVRVGLVEKIKQPRRTDPMVFFLPLACNDLNRPVEECRKSPIERVPNVTPITTRVSGDKSTVRVPLKESHTSESPNINTVSTLVDTVSSDLANKGVGKARNLFPPCPHKDLLALWDEVMPIHVPRVKQGLWTVNRKDYKYLSQRWKEGYTSKLSNDPTKTRYSTIEEALVWWRKLFVKCSRSNFLMGQRFFDLPWLVKRDHFIKILEGKYDNDA